MRIEIKRKNNHYAVMFFDQNGMSNLAKTKNIEVAKRKALKFGNYLKQGRLLRPEKSVYKY